MRAIVLEKFGGLDSLVYKDIPEPEPKAGHVVIEIKAFGINHAEMHMRRGEWAEAAEVSGIECVGIVKSCPGGEFPVGAKVAALMGGLGRTINGSYAEYTRAPASNVALIESDLPWAELAVIPETYATAWTCLFRNLEIQKGQLQTDRETRERPAPLQLALPARQAALHRRHGAGPHCRCPICRCGGDRPRRADARRLWRGRLRASRFRCDGRGRRTGGGELARHGSLSRTGTGSLVRPASQNPALE